MKHLRLFFLLLLFSNQTMAQSFASYRTLTDTTLQASQLNDQKHIQVTVPKVYQNGSHQTFPLIVVFDMQNQSNYRYILNTIDYLTSTGYMPAAVVVGIGAGEGNKRYRETQFASVYPGTYGEKNEDFLFHTLIPMARKAYKASDFTLLIGHSRYGFFTSYLMANHLNELNAVIALSPFLTQENKETNKKIDVRELLINAVKSTKLNHHVYYRFCMGNDYPEDFQRLDQAIHDGQFQNKSFDVKGAVFPSADHMLTPSLITSQALLEVFGYWNKVQKDYLRSTEISAAMIAKYRDDVKEHYGSAVTFSLSDLNGLGWGFYNEARYQEAIMAWNEVVKYYPSYSEVYLSIANSQKKLGQPTSATIKQLKESLATSAFFDAKQKEELLKAAEEF